MGDGVSSSAHGGGSSEKRAIHLQHNHPRRRRAELDADDPAALSHCHAPVWDRRHVRGPRRRFRRPYFSSRGPLEDAVPRES
eukprot:2968706-Heterocapsa_arctica.AAC.1